MDRLFLDANVLFSAAYRPDAGLFRLWKLPNVVLCSSRYALEEARVNLSTDSQRHRLVGLTAALRFFDSQATHLPAGLPEDFSLPEKDIPIFLAAIAASATHLITGDLRHFGPFLGKKIVGIHFIAPADYLRRSSS
ncbi:MAG: PIN domain-containing protein [Candidatus Acidiferrum sp.]